MSIDVDDETVRTTLAWLGDQALPAPPFHRFDTSVATGPAPAARPGRGDRRHRWLLVAAAVVVVAAGAGIWYASGADGQQLETGPAASAPSEAPATTVPPRPEPDPTATGDGTGAATQRVTDEPGSSADDEVVLPTELVELTGATTVIYRTPGPDWDGYVTVWTAGAVTRVGPLGDWMWADADFLYSGTDRQLQPNYTTDVHRHDGSLVCSVTLPADEQVHHATARPDGSIVLGISRSAGPESQGGEADALDCASGERTPIEPFIRWTGEASYEQVERVGGRTFRIFGNAEGNSGRILDERGMNLIAGDEAGVPVFAADGSRLAYGEHSRAPATHVTSDLRVRSAVDGELLWSATLPEFLASPMLFVGDRLVVPLTPAAELFTGVGPRTAIVFDAATGDELGTIGIPDNLEFVG